MSHTKIIILQLKEIIYTAIFVGFAILLLLLLFFMFWPPKAKKTTTTSATTSVSGNYVPGIYNSEIQLGKSVINIQVTMDSEHVKSVELTQLDKTVETMYPLIKPSVKEISNQLSQNISPDEVVLSKDSPYTSQMILDTVCNVMKEAQKGKTSVLP